MNLFISHKKFNWDAYKKIPLEFLHEKNLDKVKEPSKKSYYTSLEDLGIKIGQWHQVLDYVDSIILVDLDLSFPTKIDDEDIHLYINFFKTLKARYYNKTKNFAWVNELPNMFAKTNATRKDDNPCMWAAGCSITYGSAIDANDSFVNIVANNVGLDVALLAWPGATIINQCDQLLRSDIRKDDLVILGITNYARVDYAENFDWKSYTIFDITLDNQKLKYWNIDYFESYTQSYGCIKGIQQVINFCQKVGAKLVLINLFDQAWSSLVFGELPYYIDATSDLNADGSPMYIDVGSDNVHPGPKQHKEYANKILNLIKENYHG